MTLVIHPDTTDVMLGIQYINFPARTKHQNLTENDNSGIVSTRWSRTNKAIHRIGKKHIP